MQQDVSSRKHFCRLCGRGFKEAWMVKRHMLTHSLPGFFCPHCNKPFKRKDTLRMHILKCHGDVINIGNSSQRNRSISGKYTSSAIDTAPTSNSLGFEIEDVRTDLDKNNSTALNQLTSIHNPIRLDEDDNDVDEDSLNYNIDNENQMEVPVKEPSLINVHENKSSDEQLSDIQDDLDIKGSPSNEVVESVSFGNLTLINEPLNDHTDDFVNEFLPANNAMASEDMYKEKLDLEQSNLVTLPYYSDSDGI